MQHKVSPIGIISNLGPEEIDQDIADMLAFGDEQGRSLFRMLRRKRLSDSEMLLVLNASSHAFSTRFIYELMCSDAYDNMLSLLQGTARINGHDLSDDMARILLLQVSLQFMKFFYQGFDAVKTLEALKTAARIDNGGKGFE